MYNSWRSHTLPIHYYLLPHKNPVANIYLVKIEKVKSRPLTRMGFLELLARFELATSSLPMGFLPFYIVLRCAKMC